MPPQFDDVMPPGTATSWNLRPIFRARRPWAGLIAAAAATAALASLKPPGLGRLAGPLMLACHAIGVVALLTLAEEAISLLGALRALRRAKVDGLADVDGWPRRMLAAALRNRFRPSDLASDLVGKNDVDQALDRAVDAAQESYSFRWEIYRIAAFVPPLLGLVAGWRDTRAETNLASFADVFQPLAVAWIEAGTWLALTTWLSARSRAMLEEWRGLAEGLAWPSSALVAEVLGGVLTRAAAFEDPVDEAPVPRLGPHSDVDEARRSDVEEWTEPRPDGGRQDEGKTNTNSLGTIFDTLFASGRQSQVVEGHEDD
jgi:hypothetical protein